MARTVRTKVYKFNELGKDAKEKAIEWYRNYGNDICDFVWDDIKGDAKTIGLKIHTLDDHRPNRGEFIASAPDTAERILAEHGKDCETYKTAKTFLAELEALTSQYENIEDCPESDIEDLEDGFLQSLLEDYRILYNNDIDYNNSDEAIIASIIANEYEFTKDGKRF